LFLVSQGSLSFCLIPRLLKSIVYYHRDNYHHFGYSMCEGKAGSAALSWQDEILSYIITDDFV
jgi:hypothetical protein